MTFRMSEIILMSFYVGLVAVRLGSSVYLINGYLHPDEIFQSLELAAHDIYPGRCNLLTWEFKVSNHGPVRSRSVIWFFVHLPIIVTDYLAPQNTSAMSGDELVKSIMLPARVWSVVISFIPDVFIVWLGRKLYGRGNTPLVALLLHASMTYGGLLWGARTLSNAWETAAVCIFCYLSAKEGLFGLILQALVSVFAIFLRPSFPFFVFPFVFLQLWGMMRSPNRCMRFFIDIPIGLVTAIIFAMLLCYFDTIYYTGKPPTQLSELIVTPLRFISYNSAQETLSEHGLHPWYHYVIIHWPVALTPVISFLAFLPPKHTGKNVIFHYVCWTSLVLATVILSAIGHKEPRFLLPCFPIAVVLASASKKTIRRFLLFWIIYQAALAWFWGFAHQGGLLPFMRSLPTAKEDNVSANIFYETYMPPRFPFGSVDSPTPDVPPACSRLAPLDSVCSRIIDFGGRPQSDLLSFLRCLKSQAGPNTLIRLVGIFFTYCLVIYERLRIYLYARCG